MRNQKLVVAGLLGACHNWLASSRPHRARQSIQNWGKSALMIGPKGIANICGTVMDHASVNTVRIRLLGHQR
jgi:hypothetical protein